MVQDVYSKADVLNTTGSYGAPNFRQVKGSYPLYGMGQPSLNGFKQVLQRLQAQGHEVPVIFFYIHILYMHQLTKVVHMLTGSFYILKSLVFLSVHCVSARLLPSRLVSKYLGSQVLSRSCG